MLLQLAGPATRRIDADQWPAKRPSVEDIAHAAQDFAIIHVDKHGVGIDPHPDISARRLDQAELPVFGDPVAAEKERGWQSLAKGPAVIEPAARIKIRSGVKLPG